jgi:hypothetical protein
MTALEVTARRPPKTAIQAARRSRGSWPGCELARAGELTRETGTRNLGVRDGSFRLSPEVLVVHRRFLASLLLWTCLLGIVQPAFAYASWTDCCPAGACGGQPCQTATPIGTGDCCAVQPNAPSPASIRARPDLPQPSASGAPVAADLSPPDALLRDRGAWTPPRRVLAGAPFDESLTYLRTARLRL